MRSLVWMIGLLCLGSRYAGSSTLKMKYSYSSDYEIVLDERSVKDNSLVYSACIVGEFRKELNCSITLFSFPDAKIIGESTCPGNYLVADKVRNITKEFQLRRLFGDYVAFVWADEDQDDTDKKRLVLSIVNMSSCERTDHEFQTQIEQFHIVVYEQTFDVYYRDKQYCGNFLCGKTFDRRSRVINGPATSYLPSEYFYNSTRMCSVKADAASKGHFVITPNTFNLVSSYYGKKIEMGAVPFDARVATYDCSREYLGYCWLTHTKRIVNCEQFNRAGRRILSAVENLNYDPGTWMAMRNLGPHDLLIMTNECSGLDSCTGGHVKFHVLRKPVDLNRAVDLYQLSGLECGSAVAISSEVVQREDDRVCATVACHDVAVGGADQSISFLSRCFLE
ncbi:uncharacterized protein LOC131667183 [Phymastichus coffea]|uniref:uncharacterized protein LOC131667183 n=1 Tax=Phymastichus coffea TaxID=108790 RepID=UPI00273C5C80|nr:uncharacterized protein LOC131667183 [Phymastichus coffea]